MKRRRSPKVFYGSFHTTLPPSLADALTRVCQSSVMLHSLATSYNKTRGRGALLVNLDHVPFDEIPPDYIHQNWGCEEYGGPWLSEATPNYDAETEFLVQVRTSFLLDRNSSHVFRIVPL
jgi:hypothetical protein